MGSCFADEIGMRMRGTMWDVAVNPCGTLFNPSSIARTLRLAIRNEAHSHIRYTERNGICASWDFPSQFSDTTPEGNRQRCHSALSRLREYLSDAEFLIVTFGTAWVFYPAGGDVPVANCHKYPSQCFRRQRLSVDEIVADWSALLLELHAFNPRLRLIFTVSPVRHVADTLHGNNLSKSTLHLAIDTLISNPSPLPLTYFPAYEILIDDLRDYRFYAEDCAHPSPQSVDYVWEKFKNEAVDPDSLLIIRQGEKLLSRLRHRPLVDTPESRQFSIESRRLLDDFLRKHPYLFYKNGPK